MARREGVLQVALVHRPRYDDWSWAKGKLDPGEEWPVAAVRETREETGARRAPGPAAARRASTPCSTATGSPATKEVRYWAAEVAGGAGPLVNEIDEVAWLDVGRGPDRLDYARDRDQLRALVRADEPASLTTWPLALVRHAKAVRARLVARRRPAAPAGRRGRERGRPRCAPVLAAYGVTRLVSSPSAALRRHPRARMPRRAAPRCAQGRPVRGGLRRRARTRSRGHLRRLVERGGRRRCAATGRCCRRILRTVAERVDPDEPEAATCSRRLRPHGEMAKGEVLVAHLRRERRTRTSSPSSGTCPERLFAGPFGHPASRRAEPVP